MGLYNSAVVENSLVVSQKVKYRIIIWLSNYDPHFIFKRAENRFSEKYLHTLVDSGTIHNSQKVETTQVSISR